VHPELLLALRHCWSAFIRTPDKLLHLECFEPSALEIIVRHAVPVRHRRARLLHKGRNVFFRVSSPSVFVSLTKEIARMVVQRRYQVMLMYLVLNSVAGEVMNDIQPVSSFMLALIFIKFDESY
jgi:hypothetical protein